jgi:hypothetical protein
MIEFDDLPYAISDRVTAEAVGVFRERIEQLFSKYPERTTERMPFTAAECREHALAALNTVKSTDAHPQRATFWACDTGVPNDEIVVLYLLLFT